MNQIFKVISKIYEAPFIKVDATKYTEVGYQGDDASNIIVDLYKKSIFKSKQKAKCRKI